MKPSALFINAARGPLIDEAALLDTIRNGRLRGIALDVFDIEPLPVDSPWRSESWDVQGKSRVLLTPHMGYVEGGTMQTWYEETVENVERLRQTKGSTPNLVICIADNGEAGKVFNTISWEAGPYAIASF
ncbi:hypothetical protein PMIN03_001053 [Paraphaeosphaeria minitans]